MMGRKPGCAGGMLDVGSPIDWDHPLARGLVAWWMAPQGTGGSAGSRMQDLCGRRHATLTGTGLSWAGTPTGPGIAFAGTGGRLAFTIPALTGNFTVSFRCRTSGDSALMGGAGATPQLRRGASTASFVDDAANGGSTSTLPIAAGEWQTLTFARTSGTVSIYQNGTVYGTGSTSSSVSVTNIGTFINGGANFLAGAVAMASIHSRGFSPAEVVAWHNLAARGFSGPDTPLRWVSSRVWSLPTPAAGGLPSSIQGALQNALRPSFI